MADAAATESGMEPLAALRSKRRILAELAVAYGLILVVVWTPRPWQRILWMVAAFAVGGLAAHSFNGPKPLGLRTANLFRSLWVVGVALLLSAAAILIAIRLHTLFVPDTTLLFIERYWAYALWACVQQLLLQGFFLPRFVGVTRYASQAALFAAVLFSLAHLPNPILTPITFVWGLAACLLFLHYRNLYPLAVAHAIFGITIAITIPGPVDHNMRVGLGYLTYHQHMYRLATSPKP